MPVSRKRKKSKAKPRGRVSASSEITELLAVAERPSSRKAGLANPPAEVLVAELTAWSVEHPGADVEEELCARLGRLLTDLGNRPAERYVDPETFGAALVAAAAGAVRDAVREGADRVPAWRVLTAAVDVVPGSLAEEALDDLRRPPLDTDLPELPGARPVAGEVRMTRDRYGSRFAVIAPFAGPDETIRWYLWDVDTCGLKPSTVHSGFHGSPDEALSAWQEGVGAFASAGTEWHPVEDTELVRELLPAVEGALAVAGESVEQHAEYLRSRRLAESVTALPMVRPDGGPPAVPEPGAFVAWHRSAAAGPEPEFLEDAAQVLTEVWPAVVRDVYHTCSPHRVAYAKRAIEDAYVAEGVRHATALLPDWITWLGESAGTPPELLGPALRAAREDSSDVDPLARVAE